MRCFVGSEHFNVLWTFGGRIVVTQYFHDGKVGLASSMHVGIYRFLRRMETTSCGRVLF